MTLEMTNRTQTRVRQEKTTLNLVRFWLGHFENLQEDKQIKSIASVTIINIK